MSMKLGDVVRKIAPSCNPLYADSLDAADPIFQRQNITTPLRQSHFLGQFLGETGGGRVLHESGDYKTVDRLMAIFGAGNHSAAIQRGEAERLVAMPMPDKEKAIFERVYGQGNPRKAKELGNTKPGDGWVYRGIGPLQSTGRGAALRWGAKVGVNFEGDVELMLAPANVWLPSLLEWASNNLNIVADRDDGRAIRRYINGGYNGFADCVAWQNKAWAALKSPAHPEFSWQAALPSITTRDLQLDLNALGYTPALTVDGRYGPATKAAVSWFQGVARLTVDGVAGPVTTAAVALRFATKRAA